MCIRDRAEGKAEGIAIGEAKGKAEMAHEAICMYLEVRFGDASQDLQQQIKKIRELEVLDKIINEIYKASSLEEAEINIARLMLSEGEDIVKIINYTGLSREEIEKL